jgi:hypothetical protein
VGVILLGQLCAVIQLALAVGVILRIWAVLAVEQVVMEAAVVLVVIVVAVQGAGHTQVLVVEAALIMGEQVKQLKQIKRLLQLQERL